MIDYGIFRCLYEHPDFGKAEIHHFLTKNIPVLHGARVFSSTNGARTGIHMQKKK